MKGLRVGQSLKADLSRLSPYNEIPREKEKKEGK